MAELNPIQLFIPEIRSLLEQKRLAELQSLLHEINPIDLADAFPRFSTDEQLVLFRLLKPARMATLFEELDLPEQQAIVQRLDEQTVSPLLEGVPTDSIARLFHKLPAQSVRRMSRLLRKERFECVRKALEFPAGTVGALMRTDFIAIPANLTARAASDRLRVTLRLRQEAFLNNLYVIDDHNHLLGAVRLATLFSAPTQALLQDLMTPTALIKVRAGTDQEEAAKLFSKYKLISAPVVDEDNRLIGVVTVDDMLHVIEQEGTEDIQKMGAVQTFEEPYFKVRFLDMVKKRGIWLSVLFIGEMLTATAMAFFEHEIAKAVILALFIPLIISSGGNSGSQAVTLVVRAMALNEIRFSDWWRVVRREFAVGLSLGLVLGIIGFLRIALWSQVSPVYGPHYLPVAFTISAALVLVVLWGSLCGSILPIALKRAGLDPAVASAPFVATLVDVTGIVIYFGAAVFFLKGTLL